VTHHPRLTALLAASLLGFTTGCASKPGSGAGAQAHELDGAWVLKTSGLATPDKSDDDLAAFSPGEVKFHWALKGNAGTEKVTGAIGADTCISEHAVTLQVNGDGTGSITEANAGLLSSGPNACAEFKDYSLFEPGSTSLQRVSLSGNRLVLMEAGSGTVYFAVFERA
jgi:hypothetical protein